MHFVDDAAPAEAVAGHAGAEAGAGLATRNKGHCILAWAGKVKMVWPLPASSMLFIPIFYFSTFPLEK